MSYCSNCGSVVGENSNFCSVCGAKITKIEQSSNEVVLSSIDTQESFYEKNEITETEPKKFFWIKLFAILGCLINPFFTYGLSLLWNVPLAYVLFKKLKEEDEIGIGFKIVTFLFLSQIAGICLFCNKEL